MGQIVKVMGAEVLLRNLKKKTGMKSNNLMDLIFMDSCIVDDSIEITNKKSLVIEFTIPKFIEGSTCFKWHTAHH
jgi:hypothetical protein